MATTHKDDDGRSSLPEPMPEIIKIILRKKKKKKPKKEVSE